MVAKRVDSLQIWKREQQDFPILARLALRDLAVPESNGFQERVFSFVRHLDTEFRRRLSDKNLELDLLLKANSEWLSSHLEETDELKALSDEKSLKAHAELTDLFLKATMDDSKRAKYMATGLAELIQKIPPEMPVTKETGKRKMAEPRAVSNTNKFKTTTNEKVSYPAPLPTLPITVDDSSSSEADSESESD